MPRSTALEALQAAAHGFRRRSAAMGDDPLAVEAARLLAWLEERHDTDPPLAFEDLDLSRPVPAGQRVLLAGDPTAWHVRMPLRGALPQRWLPPNPGDGHLSRTAPQTLLWAPERADRRHLCGAAALLRFAADGDAGALIQILERRELPAAALLVRKRQDDDGMYVHGSGLVPRELPSPRRLLRAAFADRPEELSWLDELAEGGDHWDSGPGALPVPRGEARLPGQPPAPPTWIAKL